MASRGSTLFTLTWNDAVTPSGRRICALRASVRRISDSVCSSWPTPVVSRGDYSRRNGNPDEQTLKLSGVAKLAVWPTPMAADSSRTTLHHNHGPTNPTMLGAAKLAAWPTPLAGGGERGGSEGHMDGRRSNLMDTVMTAAWPTQLSTVAPMAAWSTPIASNANGAREYDGKRGVGLNSEVKTAAWSTPAAHEAGGTPEQFMARKAKAKAKGAKLGVSLTSLSMQAQLADSGPMPTGSSAGTLQEDRPSPGQLNPEHPRWLMAFPAGWGSYAVTGTRSTSR